MQTTHSQRVDLNLLVALAALLEERHVSRAADRVGLSQPAMSRALQRLRAALGDELLLRTGDGYRLTPRADRVQRQLAGIMPRLELLFGGENFDPVTATNVFRLAGTDFMTTVLGPSLFQRMFHEAPHTTLNLAPWHDGVFDDVERGLRDLVFFGTPVGTTLRNEQLFEERFVCLMSRDHPLAGHAGLALDDFVRCTHVVVSVRADEQTAIDRNLRELGTRRTAGLTVPFHTAAPHAIPGTMLVATLPWRMVAPLTDDPALRIVDAPPEIGTMRYVMAWHRRLDDDPAQRWMRDLVRSVVAHLPTAPGGAASPALGHRP